MSALLVFTPRVAALHALVKSRWRLVSSAGLYNPVVSLVVPTALADYVSSYGQVEFALFNYNGLLLSAVLDFRSHCKRPLRGLYAVITPRAD